MIVRQRLATEPAFHTISCCRWNAAGSSTLVAAPPMVCTPSSAPTSPLHPRTAPLLRRRAASLKGPPPLNGPPPLMTSACLQAPQVPPPPSPPLATALGSPSHLKHSVCLPHIWPCYREQSSVVTPTLPLRLVGLQLDDLCFRPQRSRNASSEPAQEDEEAGSQVQGGERCYQRGCCNRGG